MASKDKQPATTRWPAVKKSLRESGLRRAGPKTWAKMAAYVRRATRDPDWWADPETPAHERALALVLRVETALRWVHGVEVTVCEAAGPREAAPRPVEPLTLAEIEDPGEYRSNPGTTNGGIGGYHPVRSEQLATSPNTFGPRAFATVEEIGGIPELAWYWCGSICELGIGAMPVRLDSGSDGPSGHAPAGPNRHMTDAASQQREVRATLRKVPPGLRTVLELAYEDRMIDAQLVAKYGHGIAPLIARAQDAKARFVESPDGESVKALCEAMQTLSGVRKRAAHDWRPLTKEQAEDALLEAHRTYLDAKPGKPKRAKRTRKARKHEPAVLFSVPVGSGKRKIWEAA